MEVGTRGSTVTLASRRQPLGFDPFLGTSKEKTARHFQVQGVNVLAVKPAAFDLGPGAGRE